MFSRETYIARRAQLKKTVGSGLLLFLGNDECGVNYADNTYTFRQDSTFLYYFGLPYAGVDIIASNKGPLVLEVNPSPGFGIQEVSDTDITAEVIKGVLND